MSSSGRSTGLSVRASIASTVELIHQSGGGDDPRSIDSHTARASPQAYSPAFFVQERCAAIEEDCRFEALKKADRAESGLRTLRPPCGADSDLRGRLLLERLITSPAA
jgi:hypothetical protein